jgi:hypothetical protein
MAHRIGDHRYESARRHGAADAEPMRQLRDQDQASAPQDWSASRAITPPMPTNPNQMPATIITTEGYHEDVWTGGIFAALAGRRKRAASRKLWRASSCFWFSQIFLASSVEL